MSKSEWRVSSSPVWTEEGLFYKTYQVYRLRDKDATDHSGNREIYDTYIAMEVAHAKAEELNRKEETR